MNVTKAQRHGVTNSRKGFSPTGSVGFCNSALAEGSHSIDLLSARVRLF